MEQNEEFKGYVYLIRFEEKLSNLVQYYLGWTIGDPLERLKTHRSGRGAKILAACNENEIKYSIVRVWENESGDFERKLKNCKNHKRFCPVVNEKLSHHLYKHHDK